MPSPSRAALGLALTTIPLPRGGVGGAEYPGYPRREQAEVVTYGDLYKERETQRLEQQVHQLVDRITELESKLKEAGHQAGEQAGDQRTMTITDERGQPMVVPYDPLLMDVIRREQEARARKPEREELLTQLGMGKTGGTDQKDARLPPSFAA